MDQKTDVGKHKVILCGENPGLALHEPGTGRIVANASYWRCTYSAHGEGNVLVLWVEAGDAVILPGAIYADNAPLARFVVGAIVQHFETFRDRGLAELEPRQARFTQDFGGRRYHRVTCQAEGTSIELLWRDVREYQLRHFPNNREFGVAGDRVYDVTTVICPCADGQIAIDGQLVPGVVRIDTNKEPAESSAFLAFSETWVESQGS